MYDPITERTSEQTDEVLLEHIISGLRKVRFPYLFKSQLARLIDHLAEDKHCILEAFDELLQRASKKVQR